MAIPKEYQKSSLLLIKKIGIKIKLPSHKKDWKSFEFNNKSIALTILYVSYATE